MNGVPCSMLARSASIVAVSGSALMTGSTASGKRDDEKNTPETIHIGIMTRFVMPDTASIVRGLAEIN